MKVETIKTNRLSPMGDTIRITDIDDNYIQFMRSYVPQLIRMLDQHRKRPKVFTDNIR